MAVRKGGNFFKFASERGGTQKRGVPTLEETMALFIFNDLRNIDSFPLQLTN